MILDEKFRSAIRTALSLGATPEEIVGLLTRMLPELCDRRFAHAQVEAAYDLWTERHREIEVTGETGPFGRINRD